ncbi:MAG: helix-turn-helix transcriptional regulator [Flavobacteriales bacterium]|nr:helix-turn-helix transcriptional regulator [Flavobacteriales bacterium]
MLSIKLKEKLEETGLSTVAFEKKAGLKRGALQNILRGKSKHPRIDILTAISRYLNCPIEDFVEESLLIKTKNVPESDFIDWDQSLYIKTLEFISKFLKYTSVPISKKDISECIEEIYIYSSKKGKKQNIDKHFAKWFLQKKLNL